MAVRRFSAPVRVLASRPLQTLEETGSATAFELLKRLEDDGWSCRVLVPKNRRPQDFEEPQDYIPNAEPASPKLFWVRPSDANLGWSYLRALVLASSGAVTTPLAHFRKASWYDAWATGQPLPQAAPAVERFQVHGADGEAAAPAAKRRRLERAPGRQARGRGRGRGARTRAALLQPLQDGSSGSSDGGGSSGSGGGSGGTGSGDGGGPPPSDSNGSADDDCVGSTSSSDSSTPSSTPDSSGADSPRPPGTPVASSSDAVSGHGPSLGQAEAPMPRPDLAEPVYAHECRFSRIFTDGAHRGWEAACCSQDHRQPTAPGGPPRRCKRTYRFPSGATQEQKALVARRLLWWASHGMVCDTRAMHQGLSRDPPSGLPSLADLGNHLAFD